MRRAIAIVMLFVACAHSVPVAKPAAHATSMFCFEADIEHKKGKRMAACADTLPLCREAFGTARRFGGMAGVVRLFPCELWVSK